MIQTFNCPSCGELLNYDDSELTIRCPFCDSSVIVPEALRLPTISANPSDSPSLKKDLNKLRRIQQLLQANRKIEAIKIYCDTFNIGLKEAKDAIDQIEQGKYLEFSKAIAQRYGQHTTTSLIIPSITISSTRPAKKGLSGGALSGLVIGILGVIFIIGGLVSDNFRNQVVNFVRNPVQQIEQIIKYILNIPN